MSEYIYERLDEPARVVRDGWNVRIEWDFKQREEIVRCRDCAKPRTEHEDGETWLYCDQCGYVEPLGYCAWGVRRTK